MQGKIIANNVLVEPPSNDSIGPKCGTDSATKRTTRTQNVLKTALFHVKSERKEGTESTTRSLRCDSSSVDQCTVTSLY